MMDGIKKAGNERQFGLQIHINYHSIQYKSNIPIIDSN